MRAPAIPHNEVERLQALKELNLLDNAVSYLFDDAVELAAQICGCPIAVVTLVDLDRQWFACKTGLDVDETSREVSFCGHTILTHELMIVPDARVDSRFRDNPIVTGEPYVIFYAGAPLVTPEGHALGSLCVIDHEPRYLSERQVRSLERLAKFVTNQMELRRATLRTEKRALEEIALQENRSNQLVALGQDLKLSLESLIECANRIHDSVEDEGLSSTVGALRHSALSLSQISDHLVVGDLKALSSSKLQLSKFTPLEPIASALGAYTADMANRNIELTVDVDPDIDCRITSDRQRQQIMFLHLFGDLLSIDTLNSLRIEFAKIPTDHRVEVRIEALGINSPDSTTSQPELQGRHRAAIEALASQMGAHIHRAQFDLVEKISASFPYSI